MNVILTTYQGAILGPIARVLGYILQALYALLANFGIENTGICMILFTFLVNGLMMPMQIKQQKFSKMSMIMNPEILVLDEPTSQLDPIAAERFMDIVSKINEDFGITVIISEHRLDYLLKYANKLVVMEDGKLVQCGCPQEVLREALK